jgi:hypothetical protein
MFYQMQRDSRLPSTLLSSVSLIEGKLKGRHLDTIEGTETESQAVLNIHTEHDFQDAFKMAVEMGTVHTRGRR